MVDDSLTRFIVIFFIKIRQFGSAECQVRLFQSRLADWFKSCAGFSDANCAGGFGGRLKFYHNR
jgi:hypothetical protein